MNFDLINNEETIKIPACHREVHKRRASQTGVGIYCLLIAERFKTSSEGGDGGGGVKSAPLKEEHFGL